jgi:predicted SnoaL-like aldol condensation-catalyzing enzyme
MTDVLEANKALVLVFYQKALNERDADVADTFPGDSYVQHNPLVEDGPAGCAAISAGSPRTSRTPAAR